MLMKIEVSWIMNGSCITRSVGELSAPDQLRLSWIGGSKLLLGCQIWHASSDGAGLCKHLLVPVNVSFHGQVISMSKFDKLLHQRLYGSALCSLVFAAMFFQSLCHQLVDQHQLFQCTLQLLRLLIKWRCSRDCWICWTSPMMVPLVRREGV